MKSHEVNYNLKSYTACSVMIIRLCEIVPVLADGTTMPYVDKLNID